MENGDDDHVMISHIPYNSIQNLKERGNLKANIQRYNNLLQITVRDYAILYDLDYLHGKGLLYEDMREQGFGIPEVSYLDEIDLLTNPRKFVNTGFNIETSGDVIDSEIKITNRNSICTNEYSTLYFSKKTIMTHESESHNACSGVLFRTCAELDILELQRINAELAMKQPLQDISEETIVSTFQGHTIFSIYSDQIRVYEKLNEQLVLKYK